MGNLGIGNGSAATFGDLNSLPSNYSDNYFQAGDVSQEPLDPAGTESQPVPRLLPRRSRATSVPETTQRRRPGNSSHFPDGCRQAKLQRYQEQASL